MSIFDSILDKLGIHKPKIQETKKAASSAKEGRQSSTIKLMTKDWRKPVEMPMVDVVAHLDNLAATGPIKGLNWKMSINDLMALLGLDHSSAAIKELAVELGCPESEMGDSYKRNVWTHKALLKKIAENGGNIPSNLQK